jgi:hypothetical protein
MSLKNEENISEMVESWPTYLNENLLNTLKNTFKFEKMTPVQVFSLKIFSENKTFFLIFKLL